MTRGSVLLALSVLLAGCVSQPDRPPEIVSASGLVFPSEAAERQVEGYVVVAYDVTADGTVSNARVVESNPPGVFDEAALDAVRSWRFNAAVAHGTFVATQGMTSRVEFKLDESAGYVR